MSDPRSKELIKLRGSIKGKLTIFQNFVNSLDKCDHISETQYNELECRLSKIDSLQNDFDKFQTELEILSDDTSQLLLEREEFDTKYFSLVAEARTIMNRSKRHLQRRMSVSEASEGSESRDGGFHDFVRLPKISLPSFDGEKMTQWLEFRDTYLSLIHSNNNLGNINKFHYLRAALKGSALTVIKNLEFTSKNYEVAWQLLSSRYDNERLLVNIHVNSLLNFSTMTKESGKSLRNLVDTINRNLCALNTLGQPTDHWDTLVIHLMSRKLDSVTFREWEEHRNSITTSPTLKQFIDFLIGRADLLDTIQLEETQRQSTSQINQNTQFTQNKHNTQSKNTSLNKEKITLKTTACPLCTQNHFLFSCSEFRKLSVDERLEKMKNFSVCKNCLRPGHKDSQCRLTHCKYCSLKHSTLLHKDTEQHTTVALSANIQTSNKPLTLLSTALVNVVGADGKIHPARALLDNASTGHYVTQHLCEKLGLLRRSVSSSVTDASERAYGACIFVRAVDANGTVQVRLLASRNKVAPLKPTTIPRLELCGALLASRLHAKVMSSITLKVHDSFFWTDSTIVLAWLKTQSNQLKTFVRTRVGEIQDSTAGHRWSYVPSGENPADLVSRGIATNSIGSCALWWSGPDFLKTKDIQFPIIPNTQSDSTSTQRQEKTEIVLHTTTQSKDTVTHIIHELINKTSSYTHLIRSFAFVQRFIHNCKYPKNKLTQTLSTTELKNSETYILKLVQQQMFKDEYILLKSGKPIPYKNRLSSLAPFIHSDELIRVGGRLKNSHYPFDIKHPILLCGKHHLTQILFQKEHISLMHAGPQLLLSFIRQKYWPLGGRNLARRVVHRCVRCCRFKPKPIQPMMSDLPADRTRLEFPFLHTGIDYAGPIMIASRKGRGAKLEKSYICIFVCFAVKALHLELVTDLTKEAFISAFLKFISRRGKPMSVTSDNSTTFIGASNEIASFFSKYSDDIKSDLSNRDIEFRRIPQYTPHFGGLWESAVKSVKFHLKRILNLTHLTYEEMTTCLVQIEAILNSRPLTPLSSDPSDLTCLTPAHFLIGRSLLSVPRPMVSDTNIAAMDRYQRIEALKQHFWRRFSAEYVSLLQQRMKWQRGSITSLQLGSLVLVKDRAQPPLLWLLGRVEKVHPGQDGVARVAEIKTKKGVITRAFNNICPLPISNSRGQDV
ncbi:uncharacterized protein LOC123865340 isoform X2 [Maniola jurtina]|uniref:uncharacterized protein LOC123865340 isoform X2 n=1 Tax=Maniola jurtina TaxID=191418 RepID=UPI001E6884FE|nr:uncharacterized protein LOC123865340 isoform X2 [Maniola jurtina]